MKQYDISYSICKAVKTKDCKEPLVDLSKYSDDIMIDVEETSRKMQKLKKGVCFVRRSVAEKLLTVQKSLPKGLCLKVIDSYRPLSAQRKIWKQIFNEIKSKNQKMSYKEAEIETDKWVANTKKIVPQHSTGGTLDLTLCNKNRKELEMGSPPNSLGRKSITSAKISKTARKNRNILIEAMSREGFANYKNEWWHWSYGDWGWAYANKKTAIYGSIS